MKMKFRELRLYNKLDESLSVTHLNDENKLHIMTSSHCEATSISLNKTQVKRLIKKLQEWVGKR